MTTDADPFIDAIPQAIKFHDLGWGIVPAWSPRLDRPTNDKGEHPCSCPKGSRCDSPGKHPNVPKTDAKQGFVPHFLKDEDAIRTALSNPGTRNYLMVPPKNVLVADLDDEGLAKWNEVRAEIGSPGETLMTKTAHGFHAAYEIASGDDPGGNLFGVIVTRRYPGGGVIGPGSVHPSGVPYLNGGPTTPMPFPRAWLDRMNAPGMKRSHRDTPVSEVSVGNRHDWLRDEAVTFLTQQRLFERTTDAEERLWAHMSAYNAALTQPKDDEAVRKAVGNPWAALQPHPTLTVGQRPAAPRSGPLIESVLDLIKDADQPLVWAWDGSILLGSLTQALGKWESFKSMALQSLLVATYYGDSWLNRDTLQLPVAYISNEKTRQTIGKRFAKMIDSRPVDPARFLVVHRKGVQIGGRFWDEVLEAVFALNGPNLVALDTLASLAKSGFRENTSEDMGAALEGIRLLTSECQSTVILAHHPAKSGGGAGRGHGSLDGEVDGTLEFIRADRRDNLGQVDIRPKDGEFHPVQFAWDPVTYLFSDAGPLACSPSAVASFVRRRWDDDGEMTPTEIAEKYFVSVSARTVQRHLKSAVDLGLIEVATGGAGGLITVYRPVGTGGNP